MDRKSFIYSSVRLLILSIFVGFISVLFKKGKIMDSESCPENNFCSKCAGFEVCNRVQAINQRANGEK
jgi:hypothetical protein